jgi:predicted nucleotidyltransferase
MQLAIPADIQAALDQLITALQAAFGPELKAIVAYGSAARGDYRANESDVDLLVILGEDAQTSLEAVGGALKLARYSARIGVILMLERETAQAADVFPLMYGDIAEEGVALLGENPFHGLKPSEAHIRLRVEQELRDARIRLRRIIAESQAESAPLRATVERKLKQLRSPFRAALRLLAVPAPVAVPAVIEALAGRYGVAASSVLAYESEPRPAIMGLCALIDRLLGEVDALEVPSVSV